jgi:2-polyprenyl-3-methyl-5-hydroxy-6-metoxy-1,4-benzoquinol methylase
MRARACESCLICGGRSLGTLIGIPNVPTLCNRLCRSEAEAKDAPSGDISLVYCRDCGHVTNANFDRTGVNYDLRFENTLTFSPRFCKYVKATADRLINRYALVSKSIVEIGCGSGDFLHLLCSPGNYGIGYDPSQPTSRRAAGAGSLEIIGRNFTAKDARDCDFVCCRHVLEHLAEPMDLLRGLHEAMALKADTVVFFEVPNGLFTLDRLSIWDIIYEHVSYFVPASLAQAFDCAGFTVCGASSDFDDQYLWAEARVSDEASAGGVATQRPADALYRSFTTRFRERVEQWCQRIDELRSDRRNVVVWGAGAKGVMFLNLLRVTTGAGIDRVVDINPRKQGHFIPLTGQRIVGPNSLQQDPPDIVIVMNAEYQREVRCMINEIGIDCEVVSA